MLDPSGFQFVDYTTVQSSPIRARAATPYLHAQSSSQAAARLSPGAHLTAVEAGTLIPIVGQMVFTRRSARYQNVEARAHEIYERALSSRSLYQRDSAKATISKRHNAVHDVDKRLINEPSAKVMMGETGRLLSYFSRRDGSPVISRDFSLLRRDMNELLSRHIESPHEIHEHAEHAFEHAKNGLKKVGNFFKKDWEKVVDVASSALSFTPIGLAAKAAEGIEKGAMAIKSAVTGAKAGKKANEANDHAQDAKDRKDQHDQSKAAGLPDPKAAKKPAKRNTRSI